MHACVCGACIYFQRQQLPSIEVEKNMRSYKTTDPQKGIQLEQESPSIQNNAYRVNTKGL